MYYHQKNTRPTDDPTNGLGQLYADLGRGANLAWVFFDG